MPKPRCDLRYTCPISSWDEGIPLGNGKLGCLIWGPGNVLNFSIDCAGLWDTTSAPGTESPDFTYRNLIDLVYRQSWKKLQNIFDIPYSHPTPTKLPAGRLVLYGLGQTYRSRLSLQNARAALTFERGLLEAYMHAQSPVGIIVMDRIFADVKMELYAPDFSSKADADGDADCVTGKPLSALGYSPAVQISKNGVTGFVQTTGSGAFALLMAKKVLQEKIVLFFTVAQGADEETALETVRRTLSENVELDLKLLWQGHRKWWKAYWSRSEIELPSVPLERLWASATYFLASSSRRGGVPCPLQGVWTADNGLLPPWKGDYHNDLNLQFTYCHYLTANHLEEGMVLLEHLERLFPQTRKFAQRFYNVPGGSYPGDMALDGTALGGWPMYSLSPTHQIWLCQIAWRHFLYTNNLDFLREIAYPMCQQAAELIWGILCRHGDYLYLPLSASPEIHENTPAAWLTPNSNYDLALMRWLFQTMPKLEYELGLPTDSRWIRTLRNLPVLAVNREMRLMLSPDEELRESHRHFSHTIAIYPLKLLKPSEETDMRIIRQTVDGLERLGTKEWVGFSYAWMALLQAICRNGDKAEYYLTLFQDVFTGPNGFHLNGDFKQKGVSRYTYRPFTLEANFLAAEAIQHMLIQTEGMAFEVLPAVPASWKGKRLSCFDFRTDNGLQISVMRDDCNHVLVRCQAIYAGEWVFRNLNQTFSLNAGQVKTFSYCA